MEAAFNPIVYLDIGTSKVKATHLSTKWEALTKEEKFASTKTYDFPRFALAHIDTAESELDLMDNVEFVYADLFKSKSIQKYPEFENSKLKKESRFHIMQLMYNLMNGIVYPRGDNMCPLMLTHKLNSSNKHKAKIFEYAFETMNVPALYLAYTPVLTLFSEYRNTGMVIEASESSTHIVAIKDGYALKNFMGNYSRTGSYLTKELAKVAGIDAWDNLDAYERLTAELIRDGTMQPTHPLECVTNVHLDKAINETYFPDKNSVIDKLIDTIKEVKDKIISVATMFDNLTISGGIASIGGLDNKLIVKLNSSNDKKLANLIPRKAAFRYASPVIGARMLAAVPGFKDIISTKTKYYERGAEHLAAKVA